jgi:CBS domain containing-hemolysin-like protein
MEQMSTVEDNERWFRNSNVSKCIRVLRVKARDIMTPRTEIVAIDLFDPVDELNLFVKNRLF